eukprot:SAG11_NODE_30568_length_299_cov_3.405000_1_plen_45_part_10
MARGGRQCGGPVAEGRTGGDNEREIERNRENRQTNTQDGQTDGGH